MRALTLMFGLLLSSFAASAADMSRGADNFYQSEKVTREKVTFKNQYQMGVTARCTDQKRPVKRRAFRRLW